MHRPPPGKYRGGPRRPSKPPQPKHPVSLVRRDGLRGQLPENSDNWSPCSVSRGSLQLDNRFKRVGFQATSTPRGVFKTREFRDPTSSFQFRPGSNGESVDYGLEEYDEDPHTHPRVKHYKIVDQNIVQANFGPQAKTPVPHRLNLNSSVYCSNEPGIHTRLHNVIMNFAKTFMKKSPFPNGHVAVVDSLPVNIKDRDYFYVKLTRLMTVAGSHVESFSFLIHLDHPRIEYWYEKLVELLQKMPLLRTLQIILRVEEDKFNNENWEQIMLIATTNRFPNLPCLAIVDFANVPTHVTAVAIEASRNTLKYIQLRTTTVCKSEWKWNKFDYEYILDSLKLPMLEELSIKFQSVLEVNQLLKMKLPTLKKLTIYFDFNINDYKLGPPSQNVGFRLVNRFGATLETLRISFLDKPHESSRLYLPLLKNLEVFFHGRSNLNFTVTLSAVQQMKVILSDPRDDGHNIIDYLGNIRSVEDCNIWTIIRSLRKVQFSDNFSAGIVQTFSCNHTQNSTPDHIIY